MMVDYEALVWAAYFTPMGDHPVALKPQKGHEKIDEAPMVPEEDWGQRLMWWGGPGGGKTSLKRRLAKKTGSRFFALDSTMGEGALGAIPCPDPSAQVMRCWPVDFVAFDPDEYGVFLVDDMTTFPPALQPYLLGMLQQKRIGSHHLPPRVRVFGAANEVVDAPGGWDLASSVANRVCHIPFPDPSVEDWCSWLISGRGRRGAAAEIGSVVATRKEEKRVLAAWASAEAQAAGLIAGFSLARREFHRVQPPAGDPQASRAWCSPRTKEYAMLALASSYVHGLNEPTTDLLIAGYCGDAFAVEFAAYRKAMDLPNPLDFLDGKAKFEHSNFRIDRTAALIQSCAAELSREDLPHRRERTVALWKFLDSVGNDSLDTVAEIVVSVMYKLQLVTGFKEANGVLKKLRPMLDRIDGKKEAV